MKTESEFIAGRTDPLHASVWGQVRPVRDKMPNLDSGAASGVSSDMTSGLPSPIGTGFAAILPPSAATRIAMNLQFFADSGEKTEQATPKKKSDLRKKGQVMQSREISSTLLLLIMFLSMRIFGQFIYEQVASTFHFFFSEVNAGISFENTNEVMKIFAFVIWQVVKMSGPFFLIAMVIGTFGSVVQVGFLFTMDPLVPKFSKLNPFTGLKRMFSIRSVFELVKSSVKIAVVLWYAWDSISKEFVNFQKLMGLEIPALVGYMLKLTLDISIRICFALAIIAAIDWFFQWRQHEKETRMTKQQVKEEYKEMEGSPEVKSRIKQKQREISMRRMMQEVPKADVVITNPTHFAVAVRYDPSENPAPVVVAKGADFLAQRIREIAKDNQIRTIENRELARALYAAVDVGKAVPPDLYKAVAEVLAFVYGLTGKKPGEHGGTGSGRASAGKARRSRA